MTSNEVSISVQPEDPPVEQEQETVASQQIDDEVDVERRKALREKGKEWLDAALKAADKGGEAVQQLQQAPRRLRKKREPKEDPDVAAFGALLEKGMKWVYMAVFCLSTAASPVLIKGSLYSMQTPAVLLFLHMLGVTGFLWLASSYDVFHLNLTLQGLKGAAVKITLQALQMLCMFSTLHHNSVNFVLMWMLVGGELVDTAAGYLSSGTRPDQEARLLLSVATAAGALEVLLDRDRVWVGVLMMVLWTCLKGTEAGWRYLKQDPHLGGRMPGFRISGLVRELGDEEDALTAPNLAFLAHALPAIPILLLGFLALEGRELVNHELSVPAVRLMLLAIAAYVAAVSSSLLLQDRVRPSTMFALRAVAAVGTIIMFFLEEIWTISWASVLCTAVSCVCALLATKLRQQFKSGGP